MSRYTSDMSERVDELLEMDLEVGDDDWSPTPHGVLLRDVLARHNVVEGRDVLELGGGVGNQTIVLVRQEARSVVTTEILESRLETTRGNVERNCPGVDNVEYRVADWLNTHGEFDVIISNPPFAQSGKRNRRYFIDALILNAHKRLREDGSIVFVQSSMADIARTERELARNGFSFDLLGTRRGPFRDYYLEDAAFMAEIKRVPSGYEVEDDGTHMETLYVVQAKLQPSPDARGH